MLDDSELLIPIRMKPTREALAVAFQRVVELCQQAMNRCRRYAEPDRFLKTIGYLLRCHSSPFPARHRISGSVELQDRSDLLDYLWCFFSTLLRPPPLARIRLRSTKLSKSSLRPFATV